MLFDTHAHYDDERFDEDRDALLASMPENNVGLILNPGCDVETSSQRRSATNRYPFVLQPSACIPRTSRTAGRTHWRRSADWQSEPRVPRLAKSVWYYWEDERARARQQVVFARQMELARELKTPVIVHDRDAHGLSEITRRYPDVTGVYHCYAGPWKWRELPGRGYYLSIHRRYHVQKREKAVEVIREVPIERLMIETDSPYMAPEPYPRPPQFFSSTSTAWRSVLRRSRAWRPPRRAHHDRERQTAVRNCLKSFAFSVDSCPKHYIIYLSAISCRQISRT